MTDSTSRPIKQSVSESSNDNTKHRLANQVRVREQEQIIAGWKTDTVSIECVTRNGNHGASIVPHTLLLFIPGNPGCVQWYIPMLSSIVERLGEGYAARGTSYAGHGIGNDKLDKVSEFPASSGEGSSIRSSQRKAINAHSISGQVGHKLEWVDIILRQEECRLIKIIFISHSIGSHLVQRMCILRPDILSRVVNLLHLMPFIRFHPSLMSQRIPLSFVAHATIPSRTGSVGGSHRPIFVTLLETMSYMASKLPTHILDKILLHIAGIKDDGGRNFARKLVIQPVMARNFLTLGCEEIRDLPEIFDVSIHLLLLRSLPISL